MKQQADRIYWTPTEKETFMQAILRQYRDGSPTATHRRKLMMAVQSLSPDRRRAVSVLAQVYTAKNIMSRLAEENIQREKEAESLLNKPVVDKAAGFVEHLIDSAQAANDAAELERRVEEERKTGSVDRDGIITQAVTEHLEQGHRIVGVAHTVQAKLRENGLYTGISIQETKLIDDVVKKFFTPIVEKPVSASVIPFPASSKVKVDSVPDMPNEWAERGPVMGENGPLVIPGDTILNVIKGAIREGFMNYLNQIMNDHAKDIAEDTKSRIEPIIHHFSQVVGGVEADAKAFKSLMAEYLVKVEPKVEQVEQETQVQGLQWPAKDEAPPKRRIALFGILKSQEHLVLHCFRKSDLDFTFYTSDSTRTPAGFFEKVFVWAKYTPKDRQEEVQKAYSKDQVVFVHGGMSAIYRNIRQAMKIKV